jgi:hypothetical protein
MLRVMSARLIETIRPCRGSRGRLVQIAWVQWTRCPGWYFVHSIPGCGSTWPDLDRGPWLHVEMEGRGCRGPFLAGTGQQQIPERLSTLPDVVYGGELEVLRQLLAPDQSLGEPEGQVDEPTLPSAGVGNQEGSSANR